MSSNKCSHVLLHKKSERDMRLEDITTAVLKQLTLSCSECDITSLVIETPSFAFFSESPTSVTYRARLKSISETDSGSLISLIEEWVSGGTSTIVTGVLMTVDSECSVVISSLSERECSSSTDNTTVNTAAIIGGSVVAVILVITSAAVAITLGRKNNCGNVSTNK